MDATARYSLILFFHWQGPPKDRQRRRKKSKPPRQKFDADGRELCLKNGVCSKVKGHSGAHKGVPSWNSPNA